MKKLSCLFFLKLCLILYFSKCYLLRLVLHGSRQQCCYGWHNEGGFSHGRALLPEGRGWGPIILGGKPVYEGNINTFKITNPTSYMHEQTDEQHHQAFTALFSTAPIQQKWSTKCNSSSIANITKQQGQGTQDWEERQE